MSTRRRKSKCALSPADVAAIVLAIPEHDEGPVGQWDTVGAGKAVVVWWDCEDRNLSVRVQLSTRETTVSMQLDPSTRCGEPLTQSVTVGTTDPAGDPLDLVRLLEVGWDWLTGRRLPHDWPAHAPDPGNGLGGVEAGAIGPCAMNLHEDRIAPAEGLLYALAFAGKRSADLRDIACKGKGGVL